MITLLAADQLKLVSGSSCSCHNDTAILKINAAKTDNGCCHFCCEIAPITEFYRFSALNRVTATVVIIQSCPTICPTQPKLPTLARLDKSVWGGSGLAFIANNLS